MDPDVAIVPMGLGHLRTLFVRPNPNEPELDSTDDALPAVPPGTKRALIRRGRLAGEGRGAR
ncbi:hypothetical protein [Nocardia vinacea]|uniref:hypothetical protein n=1 Tax=Nocardia vinacea TaxID=96468 RepID=UPI00030414FF|nr:hypothetical protein [Nocardia vinacea]